MNNFMRITTLNQNLPMNWRSSPFRLLTASFLCAALVSFATADAQSSRPGQRPVAARPAPAPAAAEFMAVHFPDKLEWNDLGLIPNVKIAVLQGNPGAAGYYTLRLLFPAGTRMPAHWHPRVEYATVVSGTVMLGMGEKEDTSAMTPFPAGSFILAPAKMAHYGRSADDVVIQLSGPGPYEITFVNPADDPRRRQ